MDPNRAAGAPAFIVGAYAALPTEPRARDEFYELLRHQEWVEGLEIPYPGDLAADAEVLSRRLAPGWSANTITAIPGTMQRLALDPGFGLASKDAAGRAASVAFTRDIRDVVERLAELGTVIRHVQLHSAPTAAADVDAFADSLDEVMAWDWIGADLVVEHCDRHVEGQRPEKGFLALADEIAVASRMGVGIHVNWGRSALEARDAQAPLAHVVAARDAGVLRGLLFSGAGPEASSYGAAWADGHLPATADEPTSLMGEAEIRACADAARDAVAYLGAKVCVPAAASPHERLAMLARVYAATQP